MSRFLTGTSLTSRALRAVVLAMAALGCAAVVAMILVTVIDVVGRQFGRPVPGAYDLVRLCGAVAMLGALPLTKALKGHIAIEYFFRKMARSGRAVVDTLLRLVMLVFFVALAWEFARQGELFRQSGELTATLRLPVFWVFWVASVSSAAVALVTAWHLLHPGLSMMRSRS